MVVAYGAARGPRFSAGVLASMVTVIAFSSSHELEAGSFLIHPSPFINLVDRRLLSLLSSYHHLPLDVLRPHCGTTTTTTLLTNCYDPPHLLSDLTTPRSLHVYASSNETTCYDLDCASTASSTERFLVIFPLLLVTK